MTNISVNDETYTWRKEGLTGQQRALQEKEDLAALRRKITYSLRRPQERVYFQPVEGWTTGQIIGYMRGMGLEIERIRRGISTVSGSDSDSAVAAASDYTSARWRRNSALVCSQEQIMAVQAHPTKQQIPQIMEYRERYYASFGAYPQGLHYLPAIEAVWFPSSEEEKC